MSNSQVTCMEEVTSILNDFKQLSRFYQTLNHLDSLQDEISTKITKVRQQYDESKSQQQQASCTILASKLLKLHHSQYGIAKEKTEVIKQLQEMIGINKGKLSIMLKSASPTLIPNLNQPSNSDQLVRKKRLASFMRNKNKLKKSEKIVSDQLDLSGQTCLESTETLNKSQSSEL